jgi:hypothetical protein
VKRPGGLAPKTVRNIHAMLHKALADAASWQYATVNVAQHAQPRRLSRPAPSFWTPEQLRRFLVGARDDRFFALFLLATTTGMRRATLRPAVVGREPGRGKAAISATRVVVDGRPEASDGKTARSRRLLTLDPVSVEALRVRRRQQSEAWRSSARRTRSRGWSSPGKTTVRCTRTCCGSGSTGSRPGWG